MNRRAKNIFQTSFSPALLLFAVAQLCQMHFASAKRARIPSEGKRGEFSAIKSLAVLSPADGRSSTESRRRPVCSYFTRFKSKSYYFDLHTGNEFIAVELQRVENPRLLYLKLHMNQMWQITQRTDSDEPHWELIPAPDAKEPRRMVFDLLNDDVNIRRFLYKATTSTTEDETGIELTVGPGRGLCGSAPCNEGLNLTFAGGSYYPSWLVRKAMVAAREYSDNQSFENTDKQLQELREYRQVAEKITLVRHTVRDVHVVITPALTSLKVWIGGVACSLPYALIAFFFPQLPTTFLRSMLSMLPISLTLGVAAGLAKSSKVNQRKRGAFISAAEKMHEVIWCIASTSQACPPRLSKDCYLLCESDTPQNPHGSKKFVRPLIAQMKNFNCSAW